MSGGPTRRAVSAGMLAGLLAGLTSGCAAPPPAPKSPAPTSPAPPPLAAPGAGQTSTALATAIAALGPDVARAEADRAAELAISYSARLARQYNVTDPPLIHNSKVNLGLRDRGLCYHWADDLEARLAQERFSTLTLHRAIANADSLRIDHSTVILSRRGDPMQDGIVLDPWRRGGDLFWAPVRDDRRYDWVPRADVFAARRG